MKGVSPETDVVKWTFKDGTVLEVKQEEHSVSAVFHCFIYTSMEWPKKGCREVCTLFSAVLSMSNCIRFVILQAKADHAIVSRRSITTLPTLSLVPSPHSATQAFFLLFAAMPSPRALMRAPRSYNGRPTSQVMPMPGLLRMRGSSVRRLWQILRVRSARSEGFS